MLFIKAGAKLQLKIQTAKFIGKFLSFEF